MIDKNKSVFKTDTKKQLRKISLYSVIFNKSNQAEIKRINGYNNTFKYKNKAFNIIVNDDIMKMRLKGLFRNKYYLFYYIDNPDPLIIDNKKLQAYNFNSDIYNAIIETNIIKKANNINNFSLDNINPQIVIGGLIVVGIIIYFATGGTLT